MKKKIMAVTLCLAMVSTFAVGCGQKNETDSGKSEEKSSGKVEIEFVQVKREAAESYNKVIEAFEKENPDIVIKQNVVPDAQEVLMTRASSDSLPDMMNHWPTDAQFVQFEDEGLLLDLSEKDYMKNIDSKYLDAVKAKDGKNYIAPYNVNFMGVYYNKDKFEEAGYTMPTKWDTIALVVLLIVIPLTIALALNRIRRLSTLFRSIYFIPAVISMVTVGLIWNELFYRAVPAIGEMLNIEALSTSPLGNPKLAAIAIMVVNIWQGCAIPTVLFIAGLQSVPKDLLEAATIDGAGNWARFWNVIIPYLIPVLNMVIITQAKAGLTVFDYIKVMTNGGPAQSTEAV